MPRIAFLAQNRIHVRDADGTERVLTSQYGEKVRERSLQIERRHAWKTQGRGSQFMGGAMLWGGDDDPTAVPILVTGLARGADGETLLYSLRAESVSGVFSVHLETGDEKRIFHGTDRPIEDVSVSPEGVIACSTRHKNGSASIAVMARDGSEVAIVTEGDSLDTAPSWIGNSPRQLVLQSQGVGRDEVGQFVALGHATISMLDAEKGGLETIVDDAEHNHRAPKLAPDGTLFCIRSPVVRTKGVHPLKFAVDAVLFPFRVLYALAQFLNFFTMRYTGKPALNAGDARKRSQDLKKMMAKGHLMEAKDAANRAAERDDDASDQHVAADTFALVKRRPKSEAVDVVAKGVAAFDVGAAGDVVYTDGRAIFHVDATGKRAELCAPGHVERVLFLS